MLYIKKLCYVYRKNVNRGSFLKIKSNISQKEIREVNNIKIGIFNSIAFKSNDLMTYILPYVRRIFTFLTMMSDNLRSKDQTHFEKI